jgi:hypothetical protein
MIRFALPSSMAIHPLLQDSHTMNRFGPLAAPMVFTCCFVVKGVGE